MRPITANINCHPIGQCPNDIASGLAFRSKASLQRQNDFAAQIALRHKRALRLHRERFLRGFARMFLFCLPVFLPPIFLFFF